MFVRRLFAFRLACRPRPMHFSRCGANRPAATLRPQLGQETWRGRRGDKGRAVGVTGVWWLRLRLCVPHRKTCRHTECHPPCSPSHALFLLLLLLLLLQPRPPDPGLWVAPHCRTHRSGCPWTLAAAAEAARLLPPPPAGSCRWPAGAAHPPDHPAKAGWVARIVRYAVGCTMRHADLAGGASGGGQEQQQQQQAGGC